MLTWQAFPHISTCVHVGVCERAQRAWEEQGVLTGRTRAKVQPAHVCGSTLPPHQRWKKAHSRHFLQLGRASVEEVIFRGLAIFMSGVKIQHEGVTLRCVWICVYLAHFRQILSLRSLSNSAGNLFDITVKYALVFHTFYWIWLLFTRRAAKSQPIQ